MNIASTDIPLTVKEGFDGMDKEDVAVFFDSLKQQEYATIPSLTNEGLTDMRARVMLLEQLEQFVSTIKLAKQSK